MTRSAYRRGTWWAEFTEQRCSLHSTDLDRAWGKGAEIRGPVSTLMMVASGRTTLLDNLDGPGLPLLRQRLLSA